jgi:two-component system NarL family sensor kinase
MTDQPRQRRTTPRDADADVLRRRNRELATLKAIAETLNKGVSQHQIVTSTLPLVAELLGLHTGWLFLLDERAGFYVAAHHNLPPALAYPGEPWVDECTCQKLMRGGELRLAAQVVECSRLGGAAGDRRGLAYHASVPLVEGQRLLGIMNVATEHWDLFTPADLQILSAVGYQLATAIQRTQLAETATQMALVEERNRLAREVHDTLAQELAGIVLHLEAADALLDTAPERARARIRQALAQARESLAEARRSVLDLRAGPLERQTLSAALEALGRRFAEEAGIAVSADVALGGVRLPSRIEEALYRIAQEALANVRRHAQASAVWITLRLEGDQAVLTIADNGRGFAANVAPDAPPALSPASSATNASAQPGGHGFGLIGMQERAHLLSGTLRISSCPGAGTQIEARIPLEGPHQ